MFPFTKRLRMFNSCIRIELILVSFVLPTPEMLRRDPTTIHLVAEDIKDITRDVNFGLVPTHVNVLGKYGFADMNNQDDNQNWDSSLDESYLGSRSRERNERERESVETRIDDGNNQAVKNIIVNETIVKDEHDGNPNSIITGISDQSKNDVVVYPATSNPNHNNN